jgi:hypothetical protein
MTFHLMKFFLPLFFFFQILLQHFQKKVLRDYFSRISNFKFKRVKKKFLNSFQLGIFHQKFLYLNFTFYDFFLLKNILNQVLDCT